MAVTTCVVFVSAPVGRVAKRLAEQIVTRRLAACVTVIPKVFSTYRWKGKIERASESLLFIKTRRDRLPALIKAVRRLHPYEVPEIIAAPIVDGLKSYLDWVRAESKKR